MTVNEVLKVAKYDFIYVCLDNDTYRILTPTEYFHKNVEKYGNCEVTLISSYCDDTIFLTIKGV